ncbi:MAG: iron-sulfur cluster-binding domain-containing protein [Chitinophagaceae bacterium]
MLNFVAMASLSTALYHTLYIEEIREEAPDFKTFVFAPGHGIKYKGGQFLTLVLQEREEYRRSYSIASTPALNEPLAIGVKRIANGLFSRKLIDHARVGDAWLTTGAGGFFCLPPSMQSYNIIFFFAAGSGITPIFSLIKTVLLTQPFIRVVLVYSNHSIDATAFYDALNYWQIQYSPQFTIHYVFSTDSDLHKAHLNRDYLFSLLSIYRIEKEKTLLYTCGPEAYMRMVIFTLQESGFPKANIKKEDFVPHRIPKMHTVPPDTEAHQVTLRWPHHTFQLTVQYPDTILRAAKKAKIKLPYSCEQGTCGSCAARCILGRVWLSANEVLTEEDLKRGLILTCVGYPIMGDVVLEMGQ